MSDWQKIDLSDERHVRLLSLELAIKARTERSRNADLSRNAELILGDAKVFAAYIEGEARS